MSRGLTPARVEMALWTLLCGGLAIGIGVETDWGKRWHTPLADTPATAAAFAKPALTDAYRLPAADEFLEVAMRPLFIPTRRPAPAAPPPEPPKPAMARDQFTLSGITIAGGSKFAFLIEKASKKPLVVTEGKEINGIRVKEITADRVVLSQYDDTEVLLLKAAKGPATTQTPATTPTATPPAMPAAMPPGMPPAMMPGMPPATPPAMHPAVPEAPVIGGSPPRPIRQ